MARLDSVEISRFRGIREGKLEKLADVNVLVGRNNAGKSTILEAITRAAFAGSGYGILFGRNRLDAWMNARKESDAWSTPELFFGRDVAAGYEIRLREPAGTGINAIAANRFNWYQRQEIEPFLSGVSTFHRADLDNTRIEVDHWESLYAKRRDKLLVESLNEIYGAGIEQVQLPNTGRLLLGFANYGVSLDVQGDGVRAAFRCLTMLTVLEKTMLMIEEPECHQHPGSLVKFAKALCKQAKKQEVQLMLTTHSVECINAFLEAANEAKSEAAVFSLRLNDGILDARRMTGESAQRIEDSGIDLRELDLYG